MNEWCKVALSLDSYKALVQIFQIFCKVLLKINRKKLWGITTLFGQPPSDRYPNIFQRKIFKIIKKIFEKNLFLSASLRSKSIFLCSRFLEAFSKILQNNIDIL